MAAAKKVRLVLGSGGARGMAHIGIIEMLESEGYEITEVVGCSMGAVVGGIYATGKLGSYTDWLLTLTKADVWKLMDFTITRQGFVKGEKVFGPVQQMTGNWNIEDLPIPYTAVATNMITREEVHFRKGDLFQAMRASISIPGVFTPIRSNGDILVDGGVLNPLPVNLVKKREDELIVAVNINARTLEDRLIPAPEKKENGNNWLTQYWPFVKKENSSASFSLMSLMQTTYDFTQDRLTEMMLEKHRPDILINIPRSSCGIFEFHRASEIIEMGRQAYLNTMRLSVKKAGKGSSRY